MVMDIDPMAFRHQEALQDDRKHDELLRMRCLELSIQAPIRGDEIAEMIPGVSGLRLPQVIENTAQHWYKLVTGRDWPTWEPS